MVGPRLEQTRLTNWEQTRWDALLPHLQAMMPAYTQTDIRWHLPPSATPQQIRVEREAPRRTQLMEQMRRNAREIGSIVLLGTGLLLAVGAAGAGIAIANKPMAESFEAADEQARRDTVRQVLQNPTELRSFGLCKVEMTAAAQLAKARPDVAKKYAHEWDYTTAANFADATCVVPGAAQHQLQKTNNGRQVEITAVDIMPSQLDVSTYCATDSLPSGATALQALDPHTLQALDTAARQQC